MKYIIILFFLMSLQLHAFLWTYLEKQNNDDIKKTTNNNINTYLLLQAKERLELIKEYSSRSLSITNNDTLSNFDILTARNAQHISSLMSINTDPSASPLLNGRMRHVMDTLDSIVIDELKNINIFNQNLILQCNFDILPTERLRIKENISLSECLTIDNLITSFYGIGVNRHLLPSEDILVQKYNKIEFDEFKIPYEKIKSIVNDEQILVDKIPYFSIEQLKNYIDKYFISSTKTFIPLTNICTAIEKKFSVLLDTVLSLEDREYIIQHTDIVKSCTYNYFDEELIFLDDIEYNCNELKENLLSIRARVLVELNDINEEIERLDRLYTYYAEQAQREGIPSGLRMRLIQERDAIGIIRESEIEKRVEIQNEYHIIENQLEGLEC